MFYLTFAIGGIVIAAGVWMVMTANRRPPGTADWLWWTGIIAAALGGHLCFFSGMPRAQIIEWIKSEAFALTVAMLIRWPLAEPYRIPSGSMEPTLHGDERFARGDRVFVNKWIYGVRWPFMNKRIWHGQDPQRWDIVVFKTVQENAAHSTLVKRLVGLPGERIHIQDGKVFVNGKPLELPPSMPKIDYTSPPPNSLSGMSYGIRSEDEFAVVPPGHYLVLGDNSGNSADGRYFGWLPNENIVGRAACIWWPPMRWRDFTGFSQTWWWRTTVAILGLLTIVRLLIGRSWRVDGSGEHCFVSFLSFGLRLPFTRKWLVQWGHPARGAVVLYHSSSEHAHKDALFFGRVAAFAGEKTTIVNGQLLINDQPLDASSGFAQPGYALSHPDAVYGRSRARNTTVVPDGCFFIVADPVGGASEETPLDSRILGWIPRENCIGQAAFVWWPIWKAKRIL